MPAILRILAIVAIVYLIVMLFVFVRQRSFIYFPANEAPPPGFEQYYGVEKVSVHVPEIGNIQSFFRPPPDKAPFVIVFHGNASEAYHLTNEIESFHDWGVGFLIVEYPGYGGNPGTVGEDSFLASAEAHFDWAVSNGINPENIVLYGQSLGAASAVHLASKNDVGQLVLISPFLSARAMARRQMPYFPTGLLLKDQFRSDLKMKSVSAPLLVVHGQKDRVIPHDMGKALADIHTGDTKFVSIPNGSHNNLWGTEMPERIRQAVYLHTGAAGP